MRFAILALMLALPACAGVPDTRPVNAPLAGPPVATSGDLGVDGEAIALSFSGGGARAASFSLGSLLALRDMRGADGGRLIDRVSLVTAVSGGAITAAYFGQYGASGLDGFREAALDKDWAGELHTSFANPNNLLRIYRGGMNDRRLLADWLDREVFSGGHMRDLGAGRPRIVINATELYTGAPFAFAGPYFEAICSDLPSLRIADAVAASMAVPLAFHPVTLESFPGACPGPLPEWVRAAARNRSASVLLRETAKAFEAYRDPARMRYLHLADGGVVDNFGLSSLIAMREATAGPNGPFSERDAVKLSRLTFIVVNAELSPSGAWSLSPSGPDGAAMLDAALSDSINANKRMAMLAFSAMLADWKRDLVQWRCALSPEAARRLGAGPGWRCEALEMRLDMISFADLPEDSYRRLGAVPTAVSLPRETIDELIAAGRYAMQREPMIQDLARR